MPRGGPRAAAQLVDDGLDERLLHGARRDGQGGAEELRRAERAVRAAALDRRRHRLGSPVRFSSL